MTATYQEFLEAKVATAPKLGLDVDPAEVNPVLKPHQRDAVVWAIRGGRRALFEAFGLGKTIQQLEIVRLVQAKAGGRGLIVLPLGVRQEFRRDAVERLGWPEPPRFIRSIEEADATGLYLTNYETVRDRKLNPDDFTVASLDEAAILRGFGGTKTFRSFMDLFAGDDGGTGASRRGVPYRFVATACPSPNEFIELLAYAAYLGVMQVSEAKTRFFKRDSTHADRLTLHEHKKAEFWKWVSGWALFLQKPSDLGYSDEGYEIPEPEIHWHELPSDHAHAGAETDGQERLFRDTALGLSAAAREKRESLSARIGKLLELRATDPTAHRVIWHDLEAERDALEDVLPRAIYHHWQEFKDGNSAGLALYERHYSAHHYADGRVRDLFMGPGQKTVLLTRDGKALFGWRKFIDESGQQGINCSVFRNEGPLLSSDLIKEAMAVAWLRWPGERLYTFVDGDEIRSTNPGYCFLQAGWSRCGETKGGLIILEALPGVAVPSITPTTGARSVYGSQELDEREESILAFSDGKIQELAAKPVLAGSGCNFQRHCAWAIYLGIGFKFSDFIQSFHRIVRFLQTKRPRIDLIYTEAERHVRKTLERKWEEHKTLVANMTALIREYGLAHTDTIGLARSMEVNRTEASGEGYRLICGDAIEEARGLEPDSVDLIVTSIPFSTQYEYTPSYRDLGHTDDDEHFFAHLAFLTPELLRVLRPGRVAAVHVKDRIVPSGLSGMGFQTVSPFSDYTIAHFRKHGFGFLARKTVVTDVVRENNQTYRLGWSEQCKDGSRMGSGMPEYVLLFRKPPTDRSNGYADVPVVKEKPLCDDHGAPVPFDPRTNWKQPIPGTGYSRARWQFDAHGFTRSSGDRLLSSEELLNLPHAQLFKLWRDRSRDSVYDFNGHVAISEDLDRARRLPATFMLLPPHSWHPDVWTDITRMRTLNGAQSAKGKELHLCPIQFDIVDRLITQFSMPGETVCDPFGGLMTVPYCALKLGRRGLGIELNPRYFADGVAYCAAAAHQVDMPSLFSVLDEAELETEHAG